MKNHFLFFLIILFFAEVQSQSLLKEIENKDIIKGTNQLFFPTNNRLPLFFKKMDRLIFEGEGKINILHIGGSHVQAGVFSHAIYHNLLSVFPHITGGLGIVFPFSAAKTNNPYAFTTTYDGKWLSLRNVNREIPYPLGLSGMLIVSQDEDAKIGIAARTNGNTCFELNSIRLLGYCDSGYVKPLLSTDSDTIEGVYDSISKSYLFTLEKYVDNFCVSFEKINDTLWEPFYVRGFIVENPFSGITYHAVGVNGASVPSYLKCEYFENDLSFIKPDLCVFAIGINDASGDAFDTVVFKKNYDALIQRIYSVSPDCEFIFITNNDSYKRHRKRYYNNTNGLLAKEAFYQLAEKYNAGVWDLFSLMGGLQSMKQWEEEGLSQRDKVHFTSKGYRLVGDLFYNALITEYIHYLKEYSKRYGN